MTIQDTPAQEITVLDKPKRGRKPGFVGTSNREISYVCDDCSADVGPGNLVTKRAMFATIGKPSRSIRTRTVKYICRPCMEADPDYQRQALVGVTLHEGSTDGAGE